MEVLSPVGNSEALIAAVRSGADAVYLGLKSFSARRNADNFDLPEFRQAAEYCHTRGVKVYVALNIMIKENEIGEAVNAAIQAANFGADAFIVSDLGFISILHRALPEAVLHASTQMTVHSPSAITALKKLGVKRVVLGREMSRQEIKEFCTAAKAENIEVEVFVHGALCMCVSGKCLLSSTLGGRSGNRGLCAGPCRLMFSSSDDERYDLSLKDLSLIDYINELKCLGVTSAKIEGRMKRPEYVAAATAACRAALDGVPDGELLSALKNVFSRSGFTDGYYKGTPGCDMFGIRTKDDVDISKTAFAYLHSLYRNERQSVPVKIYAKMSAGTPAEVLFEDDKGNRASIKGKVPEIAQKRSIQEKDIATSLSKLGGTPYYAGSVEVYTGDGLYLNNAELNNMRREAVKKLNKLRAQLKKCDTAYYKQISPQTKKSNGTRLYAKFLKLSDIPQDVFLDGVILPLDCDFGKIPKETVKIVELPRYITDENAVLNRLKDIKSDGVNTAYCDNLSAVVLARQEGLKVIASNGLNCANCESAAVLKELGADMVTISAEINMESAKKIASMGDTGIFAYGRLPLMLTRNCPIKNTKTCKECKGENNLTDRLGLNFPVRCRNGYSEILNSAPVFIADKQDDLKAFDFLILSFTLEPKEDVKSVINSYLTGASGKGEFTRGLYYKNLP
ncbi:MAG: U32 family peptidase [Clostridia bacterium]|nr:U32 family peptidase [Clostridia bacterium]